MSKKKVHIDISFDFYNGLYIGGGKGTPEFALYTLKDIENNPYIPGSTLKGKLRYLVSTIYNGLGHKCDFYFEKNEGCNCILCKMFGYSNRKKGQLNFQNMYLDTENIYKENENYIYDSRTSIQINRYTKVVTDKALFNYQTACTREHLYKGEIDGYLDEEIFKKQLILLNLGFNMMDTIGGFQSRGIGWLGETKNLDIYVDGEKVTNEMFNKWRGELEVRI